MSTITITPTRQLPEVPQGPQGPQLVPAAVRLTRRGRLVMFAACLVLTLVAVVLVIGGASVATEEAGVAPPTRIVMVHEGDTLWSIAAARTADGQDVRDTMTRIERLNALASEIVYAGQRLRVPLA